MSPDARAIPLPAADALPHLRVDVHTLASGQPRAYADSIYEAVLVFANWWDHTRDGKTRGTWEPTERQVKAVAQALVRDFVAGETRFMRDPYLKVCEKVAPYTWHVLIVEPYND